MEVKPGYKRSEVGIIPDDWCVESIGHLINDKFILGHLDGNHGELYPRSHEFKSHGVPYIGANDFDDGYVSFDRCKFLTPDRAKQFRKGVAQDGDVLFAHNATVGPVALLRTNEPFVVLSTTATYFRCDPLRLNNLYLKGALQAGHFVRQYQGVMAQTTRFQVPITAQRKLFVVVPPLPEQRAIAATLGDVDALLGGLDRLIAKKRDLKQAAMQQLLTGQVRLPGFHEPWRVKTLKEIVQTAITDGPHLTPEFLETGVPFLSVNNLVDNKVDLRDLRFISQADHEVFSRKCKPRMNDILLGKAASVGRVAIVELDFEFNVWSPIAVIRVGEHDDPRFVYFQLQSSETAGQIALLTNSSSQGNIGMGDIERLQLALPHLDEQSAIAIVLTDMDAELSALEARRTKTRALKQAMMQALLTGKIRLV